MVETDGLRISPEEATRRRWDLVVVGGGFVGAAVLLEATRRGLTALLVERDDFGSHTSANSLRIVHGGLRYLQRLDVARYRRSVVERSRWLHDFPDLVTPLPCLMPLSGRGLERPAVLRSALAIDQLLSAGRNRGLAKDSRLPRCLVLDSASTYERCPILAGRPMAGSALWWDARIERPQRLLMELLRWAVSGGAVALNRVEAKELRIEGGRATGITILDHTSGKNLALSTQHVVNASGPWCREVAIRWDRAREARLSGLFRPSLALNLLLDRSLGGDVDYPALALAPCSGASKLFLVPWRGRILAGTHHVALDRELNSVRTDEPELHEILDRAVDEFLGNVERALPSLQLDRAAIRHVFWGFLPAEASGDATLARRPILWNHEQHGGPRGLVSVSGIKLTTSRRLAQEALDMLIQRRPAPLPRPEAAPWPTAAEAASSLALDPDAFLQHIAQLAASERVRSAEDLLRHRTDWGLHIDLHPTLEKVPGSLGLA